MHGTTLADLSALVQMVTVVIGTIYVARQFREMRKSRLLDFYGEIARRIDEQRDDRRSLYESHVGDRRDKPWNDRFERVAVTFDMLGILVREDLIYRPIIFKLYYDVIIKTWDSVKWHVQSERERKAKTYMSDFQYLYAEARRYCEREGFEYPSVHAPDGSVPPA